jgi:putative endonuclease
MPAGTESAPAIGSVWEDQALRYLQAQGLRLLERNYRCRRGEIDLVMRDDGCLVFVEVRYRKSSAYGTAAETVTRTKQRRITAAAQRYLQQHPSRLDCRFDILGIDAAGGVQWLRNAFDAVG